MKDKQLSVTKQDIAYKLLVALISDLGLNFLILLYRCPGGTSFAGVYSTIPLDACGKASLLLPLLLPRKAESQGDSHLLVLKRGLIKLNPAM